MDPERQAVATALSQTLSGGDASVESRLLLCLRTRCQQTTARCLGRGGPCEQRAAKVAARRGCRPLRETLLAAARADICAPYVERMRPALTQQCGGDAAAVAERVETMTRDCCAANVEKRARRVRRRRSAGDRGALRRDKRYTGCIFGRLRESLVTCATARCDAAAAACAAKQCDIVRLPERP